MNKPIINKLGLHGVVERRLFDGQLFAQAKAAFIAGNIVEGEKLLELASRPMFRGNSIWKVLNRHFGVDLKLPFITGLWTKNAIADNLITTKGKEMVADQLGGTTTAPVTAVAIGTGAVAAAAADTTLGAEITTLGGQRGAATVTNITTTTTNDTEQWVRSFTFTGTFAVTEEGLFDNNASGGNLLARQVFSAVNVASGDVLQITHKVQVT